jgi:hypothetical protein
VPDVLGAWPPDVLQRYRWKGAFWAESVRIKYEMRQRLGASHYLGAATDKPIACDELLPSVPFAHLAPQMAGGR